MNEKLPPSKFGAGYTVGGDPPQQPHVGPPHTNGSPPHVGASAGQPASPVPPPGYPMPSPLSESLSPTGSAWTGYPPRPTSAASGSGVIAKLRSNKLLLHTGIGALGGMVGTLLAELAPSNWATSDFEMTMEVGIWAGIVASVIATALFISDMWHRRRPLRPTALAIAWLSGAGGGFIAGAVAQAVFLVDVGSFEFKNYVLRTICWGIAGMLIGGLLSRTVPNLGLARGFSAGFVGGCVGGTLFVLIARELPDVAGRICGFAALGLALGLAMYMVETLFREASLEIIWGPNETSRAALGAQPIIIGGGIEDDVHVPGLPANALTVVLDNGQIAQIDNYTGARTFLRDRSQMQVGPIYVVVHARK